MPIRRRRSLLAGLLALSSSAFWAGVASAQLPNCDCYFNKDCPAEKPVCQLTLSGGGSTGPADPDRACEWRKPKPTAGPGTGCDQPYDGSGGPCDGICVEGPPAIHAQQWDHWDGRPVPNYSGSGCLPGGPYSYFIKFVVENEPCDLPPHCSLCESNISIPSGTLATGTAALVESQLTADCAVEGFSFDVSAQTVFAEIAGQIFDVCVNGVKVASAMAPPGQAIVCPDGTNPDTNQVAGDFVIVPGLSERAMGILICAMLAGSVAALLHRARNA